MVENPHRVPGLLTLVRKAASTGLGALENRAELFALEWKEERLRLCELLAWTALLLVLTLVGVMLLTATVIFLFPADWRLYAAGGFGLVYLAGAVAAWMHFKSLLKPEPFSETLNQMKKDREWLDSLK